MPLPQWVPNSGAASDWIKEQMDDGVDPRMMLNQFLPHLRLRGDLDSSTLWQLISDILSEPDKRQKLSNLNTLSDTMDLLRKSQKILVLTGAGVSVSCGIPDFRSKNGIYARLHKDFPDLPDPQSMFDIEYFRSNPRPFFDFAREIFPGQFKPSLSHLFIKMLETQGKLLRNYTQNIDTLEQVAGIKRVVQCHGSFAMATCCVCKHKVDGDFIKESVLDKKIPHCPICPPESELSVLKPDIVFFGEDLPKEFHDQISGDKIEADLLIVIGSSLKVRPVALVPNCLPDEIPQILINREPLNHLNFDVELLGDCDNVISELCLRLGPPWDTVCQRENFRPLQEIVSLPSADDEKPSTDDEQPSPKKIRRSEDAGCSAPSDGAADAYDGVTSEMAEKFKKKFDNVLSREADNLRKMYKPRMQKISSLLPEDTFLFVKPNRYIFQGAEIYRDLDAADADSTSSSTSSSSSDEQSGYESDCSESESDQKSVPKLDEPCQNGKN